MLFSSQVKAQANTISGTVTSDSGMVLSSATITVKQTKASTVSDAQGKFTIGVASGQTLVITMVGYDTREITVRKETDLLVKLQQITATMNEVVVVGYGTQRKKDLTGSVASMIFICDSFFLPAAL